jgi:hypothetical protein
MDRINRVGAHPEVRVEGRAIPIVATAILRLQQYPRVISELTQNEFMSNGRGDFVPHVPAKTLSEYFPNRAEFLTTILNLAMKSK